MALPFVAKSDRLEGRTATLLVSPATSVEVTGDVTGDVTLDDLRNVCPGF